jgi:hypothetical protein
VGSTFVANSSFGDFGDSDFVGFAFDFEGGFCGVEGVDFDEGGVCLDPLDSFADEASDFGGLVCEDFEGASTFGDFVGSNLVGFAADSTFGFADSDFVSFVISSFVAFVFSDFVDFAGSSGFVGFVVFSPFVESVLAFVGKSFVDFVADALMGATGALVRGDGFEDSFADVALATVEVFTDLLIQRDEEALKALSCCHWQGTSRHCRRNKRIEFITK